MAVQEEGRTRQMASEAAEKKVVNVQWPTGPKRISARIAGSRKKKAQGSIKRRYKKGRLDEKLWPGSVVNERAEKDNPENKSRTRLAGLHLQRPSSRE